MDDITVLITGAGAPGIKGTLYSLKNNFDNRKITTVGTDIKDNVVGKYLCNKFYQIEKPETSEYLSRLSEICKEECVDVFLPQNTAELSILAKNKKFFKKIGTTVAISSYESIELANDKFKLMKVADEVGVPTPKYYMADNPDDLVRYAETLGYPDKPVVVKPPVSNGMRGFRIIDDTKDLKKMFYEDKPNNVYITMDNLKNVLGSNFPPILVMEFLPNEEYTVDLLKSKELVIVPRKRDSIRSGISFVGTVEKHEKIIEYSKKLGERADLEYAYGFQFKLDRHGIPKLLESNPRIQGTMVLSTFAGANLIYGAVKHALNEEVSEFNIDWGTQIIRYWGGLGVLEESIRGVL